MMSSRFKAYVDITEYGSEDYDCLCNDTEQLKLDANLMPGEVVVASAPNVLKFASISNRKHGTSGRLFITNFKIAFVSPTSTYSQNSKDERNKILGPYEICLANIDAVYQVNGDRRKRLLPGLSTVSHIKTLQIVCKDFSVHSYSFKFCPELYHKTVINAILHHGFPKRIELLFTFECKLPGTQPVNGTRLFYTMEDWESELERCNCLGSWKICLANETYKLSTSLPGAFVVPRSLSDNQILKASKHFMGNRPPIWCWGHTNKCVIVRMANLYPFITDTQQESIMLEHVRKSHSNLREPLILELDKSMPSLNEIQISWCKLRDYCCSPVDSIQKFWELDNKYFSLISNSRWPHHVALCLKIANRVAKNIIEHQISVVLQEGESRDFSAVISSLAQLIMDPYFRTIDGFQSLIQKEWVALGHPFTKRFARVADYEAAQAPLFQLFLDCVWQMQNQFTASFEFTETYLTSVWDSLHNTVFDTFVFDSQRQRQLASEDSTIHSSPTCFISRSVWCWESQFHNIDTGLFLNPLYTVSEKVVKCRERKNRPIYDTPSLPVLPPLHALNLTNSPLPDRSRRSSIASLTLSRRDFSHLSEYGGHESGTDTLGRNWGSRLGISGGLATEPVLRPEGSSRWKKIRGALFHGGSYSPRTKIASIDEGLESKHLTQESNLVTYRGTRSYHEPIQQRWTVYGDHTTVDPLSSNRIKLCPVKQNINFEPKWEDGEIPYEDLFWPVYSVLPVSDLLTSYQFWVQCYLRWIPVLDIRGGGHPPIYFQHCGLINDILDLEHQILKLEGLEQLAVPNERFVTMSYHNSSEGNATAMVSSFHPFVQQCNGTALSFGEWEIVPSLIPFLDKQDTEFDSSTE